jgi:NAD(P)-dependent dehydrogenase (short-subunit alcohol dehydrogenase family)
MPGRLENKVALVVGAGSIAPGWGNGKATAVLFAREGARVLAADLRLEAAQETVDIIEREGGTATAVAVDVADSETVAAMVRRCIELHGRIDVLHNNVGIIDMDAEDEEAAWDRVHSVNLKGTWLSCRAALPIMQKQGSGAIVNVSSIAALRYGGAQYMVYGASKVGVLSLTRDLALKHAREGIRVNAVIPGLIDTPMVEVGYRGRVAPDELEALRELRRDASPTGAMGTAWDVAHAALFLAGDEARYVNATEIVVDGGLTHGLPQVGASREG